MPRFSKRSLARLETCDIRLQLLMKEVIKRTDITILCGFRDKATQEKAFKNGSSRLHWPQSFHNRKPALAVDVAPWVNGNVSWLWEYYYPLAEIVKEEAKKLGITGLQWGGDWISPKDGPHWQVPAMTDEDRERWLGAHDAKHPDEGSDGDFDSLIQAAALNAGLPVNLVRAMVQVESGGNPDAVRYEPRFYARYIQGKDLPCFGKCTQEEEDMYRATSFGLLQIMGEVARELGFMEPFLAQLFDPATNLFWACKYIVKLRADLSRKFYGHVSWECVCAAYNAGEGCVTSATTHRNPKYAALVLKALGGSWPRE